MINKILEKLPIVSCEEATRLASIAMERRLSFKETIDLKLHLIVCSLCVQFQKHIRGLRQTLRSYHPQGENTLSASSKSNLKKAIQKQIN